MKKRVILLIISVVIIIGFLCGCNENKDNESKLDKEKFIGKWLEEGDVPNNLTWIFYENNSIKFIYYPGGNTGSYYIYWGAFELNGDILDVDAMPILSMRYTYDFSNNNEKLTLTSIYGGDQTIINKVE